MTRRIAALAAAAACLASACASAGSDFPGTSPGTDGGGLAGFDGGRGGVEGGFPASDAAAAEAGAPPPLGPGPVPADPSGFSASGDTEGPPSGNGAVDPSCYDGTDDNGNSFIDCADPACASARSCCVGSGDCCAAEATAPNDDLDFSSCATGSDYSCLAGYGNVTPFGNSGPWVQDRALACGGNASSDGGLLVGAPIDLTSRRLAIDVTFAGADPSCTTSCLESAAVGLTTQALPAVGTDAHVEPAVALVLSGSRRTVSLVVGDSAVASWPFTDGDGPWSLVLRPTGELSIAHGTTVAMTSAYVPTTGAQLVLFGRSRNPSTAAPYGARIAALTTSTSLCDIPSGWSARQALALGDRSTPSVAVDDAAGPSFGAASDGNTLMAFERGGDVFLAERPDESAPASFTFVAFSSQVGLARDESWDVGGAHDPELVDQAGADPVMFFTAVDADGARRIGRAVLDPTDHTYHAQPADAPVVDPAVLPGAASAVDGPTVVAYRADLWVMVVRASDGAKTWLAILTSDDGGLTWSPYGPTDLPRMFDPTAGTLPPALDADEVASPSLVIHDGAWQLYYARRRGARWSIGLLVSDELVSWRHMDQGASVMGAGANAFERLGVTDPDVREVPGQQEIEMLYVGLDGVGRTPAWAVRDAADHGMLLP